MPVSPPSPGLTAPSEDNVASNAHFPSRRHPSYRAEGQEADFSSTIGRGCQLPKEGCRAAGDCPVVGGTQAEVGCPPSVRADWYMGKVVGLMSQECLPISTVF